MCKHLTAPGQMLQNKGGGDFSGHDFNALPCRYMEIFWQAKIPGYCRPGTIKRGNKIIHLHSNNSPPMFLLTSETLVFQKSRNHIKWSLHVKRPPMKIKEERLWPPCFACKSSRRHLGSHCIKQNIGLHGPWSDLA